MAAGGVYDIEYWHVFMLSQQMGIFGDERIWLGGLGRNTTGKNAPALTGMCNDASNINVTTPVVDLGFSDGKADFDDMFADCLTSLKSNSVFEDGKNVVVTTPGICAQTTLEDSAVGDLKTLYQILQDKWFRSGQVQEWWCSENVVATALASMTNTTQACFFFRVGRGTMQRKVVYPLQRKILSDKHKQFPDDVAFAYITGDIMTFYDKNALIHCAASTSGSITELKGWDKNRLFMTPDTNYQKAYRPPVRG